MSAVRSTRNSVDDGSGGIEIHCAHSACGQRIKVDNNDTYVTCCTCRLHFHTSARCGNVNATLYKELSKPSSQVFWSCISCLPTTKAIFGGISSNNTQLQKLTEQVANLTSLVESLATSPRICSDSGGDAANYANAVMHGRQSDQQKVVADAVAEIADQERRKSNLIVFGLSEVGDDAAAIEELVVSTGVEPSDVCIKHVGRIKAKASVGGTGGGGAADGTPKRPPPVKIVFSEPSHASTLLKHCRNLGGPNVDPRFKACSVKRDFTPAQRDVELALYRDYKARKNSGEAVVIYRRKIVAKNLLPTRGLSAAARVQSNQPSQTRDPPGQSQ